MRRATVVTMFAATLLISLSMSSNSQTLRMGSYLHPRNDTEKALSDAYVAGLRDGYGSYWALERLQNPAAKKLYCFPENLVLKVEQAEEIIRTTIWSELRYCLPCSRVFLVRNEMQWPAQNFLQKFSGQRIKCERSYCGV